MDVANILTSMPSFVLFVLVVATGMLSSWAGTWVAGKRYQKGVKELTTSTTTAVGAILGLSAFMLGFTFSMTAARFSSRKQLVVQQAGAIGTSFLQTGLIPERQKLIIREQLRQYIDVLLNTKNSSDIDKKLERLDKLHYSIWHQTASLLNQPMDSELRSIFTSSINSVIEFGAERKTVALIYKLASMLWISLLTLFLLSMFSLGYHTDDYKKHGNLNGLLLASSFAMVIVLIADMDSQGLHSFKISQRPLEDIRQMMGANIP
ncbi:MAG TPA: hypothetical protein VKA49_17980 [Flavitalea sp.]|nr:hypothetical protein [Flavitalea sp.]